MDRDKKETTEQILSLTLEILYLLTGEDYMVVKKLTGELLTTSSGRISGGLRRIQYPIMKSSPLITKRSNEQKILELTNKIIELLTGEDFEEEKELHKEVLRRNIWNFRSQDGSSKSNIPEKCLSSLYSLDGLERSHNVSQNKQGDDFFVVKVEDVCEDEESYGRDIQLCKDELSKGVSQEKKNNLLITIWIRSLQKFQQKDTAAETPQSDVWFYLIIAQQKTTSLKIL
ncbi:uncharacterized protein LOC142311095 isoform X2 [Anomaloglossus baeobatrachus]|uniref:uncharacterized protein LOC142311095 isoform X2 n=1 Tax=Anomaloglossus baeobatrachus TaxID=238106 RepID=UPI003F5008AF